MPRSTWLNILIILLVIIAAAYVMQLLLGLLSGFADIILIVLLSWLIAYALSPLVDTLHERKLPAAWVNATGSAERGIGKQLSQFQITRTLAVALVYLGLALVVIIVIASLIPTILAQVNAIAPQLSNIAVLELGLSKAFQEILAALNIALNVQNLIDSVFNSLQSFATPLLQNTVAILTSVISLLGNALLVILFSFFFALDGPRFNKMLFEVIPERLHQETRMFLLTTDRVFGEFLRSQLLQAALVGVVTGILLGVFGVQAALLASLFAALFMLIPLIGPFLAILPPLLAVLLTDPSRTLFVMVPLIVAVVVIVNVVMPRVMGNALGLHPLVIIVSLLIGVKIAGFWGAFFAMPVAGIISAFGAFLIRRRQRLTELASAIVHENEGDASAPLEASLLADPKAEGQTTPPIPSSKQSRV